MKLLLPNNVMRKMRFHMLRAGRREIGGLIMGEELSEQTFRLVDFSVDSISGTRSSFVRDDKQHERALSNFFEKTGANYRRFNYLGEWHTHPSFSVHPSSQDIHAMQDLVSCSGDVNFAVLFIAKLKWYWRFEACAYLFVREHLPSPVELIHESKAFLNYGIK
ncbi:Mov34/MPN/PAD-1 family protein [Pleionea litopenaei]|uniref:Mov34/MPN/PAD-1 family protein n=1 Tax=Pleionea litopenaei TaxID=3070815 RepID=A0AA51RUT7_9GAMM|nr:Mov34/MPN/PAD-1 family protein [Pleionea sp. HL-JVS1]WMS87904.1 Mov34/MPN/PAD-1 family protein [Pleionea sp. HL-JVS1]